MTKSSEKDSFDYTTLPEGYYQEVIESGSPVRRAWHSQKFERVMECLPKKPGQSILDVGCFAGSFLSLLSSETFSRQVGVDIVEKQITYANRRFQTAYRSFQYIPHVSAIGKLDGTFDCVTVIDVIEHIDEASIAELVAQVSAKMNKGGSLVLGTPNYTSFWPVLEILVNKLSDISYEEQHITKFNYFNCVSKLRRISPELSTKFDFAFKTTSHFIAPFVAAVSFKAAMAMSHSFPIARLRNPFGSELTLVFKKK